MYADIQHLYPDAKDHLPFRKSDAFQVDQLSKFKEGTLQHSSLLKEAKQRSPRKDQDDYSRENPRLQQPESINEALLHSINRDTLQHPWSEESVAHPLNSETLHQLLSVEERQHPSSKRTKQKAEKRARTNAKQERKLMNSLREVNCELRSKCDSWNSPPHSENCFLLARWID